MLVYGLGPGLGSEVKAYKVLGDASGLAGRVRGGFKCTKLGLHNL